MLVLVLAFGILPVRAEEESWMAFQSLTEPIYTKVYAQYTQPVYAGEEVAFAAELNLVIGDTAAVAIDVPADGLYEIWLTYRNTTQSALPTEMTVRLDDEIPFYEMRRIKLKSLWVDDGVFPTDRYGNEVQPVTRAADVWQTVGMADAAGRTSVPFLYQLTAGNHELQFQVNEGATKISGVALRAPALLPAYQGGDTSGKALIVIEGEAIDSRNSSSIHASGAYDTQLTPYSSEKRLINHLEGGSFSTAGDSVSYRFTAETEGWYQLGFYYNQSGKTDFYVYVDIAIDGQMPSEKANRVAFDYNNSYELLTVDADGVPQAFYLTAGEHTLTLTINADVLTPVYEMIDSLLRRINGLSLEVVRLTGGITTDKYRDYHLTTYIPGLQDMLYAWAEECEDTASSMKVYSSKGKTSLFANLLLCADQLRRLGDKPEDLPRRLTELSTGATSAARMLAQQLQDMADNSLGIDQIYFYQTDAQLPGRPGFFSALGQSIQRFFNSFQAQEYSAAAGDGEHLQVWIGRSRQYAEILQNMIDTQFTPQTGIAVDLSLMPDANKLVLANAAGTAPDAVISLQYVVPSYLNIRGALYDLTQFEDFGLVAQRFADGLFVPYTLGDGIYAMPETVNFWVMFYRSDILEALNIDVPNSLDEVKLILPELQRRNMNFYCPTAGMIGLKVFPGTLPLILQAGGSIYAENLGNTTLDSDKSLAGFREMTDLFTIYNMPPDVPAPGFYQQFRAGTLPIGIADLATYNLLLNAAPELEGLWDIALFPGLTNEDGEVQRWTTGGAETMGILSGTQRPDDAWKFLKWWSSEEVQAQFGNLLQSTYGPEYIWPTANMNAFAQLPLKSSHKQVVMDQMEWMTEAPWVLGTYMLERELSNAYISVIVDGTEARRALDTAVKRINRETFRKLEEFGYYKDGEMLKDFPTPTVETVRSIIAQYNATHEEGNK